MANITAFETSSGLSMGNCLITSANSFGKMSVSVAPGLMLWNYQIANIQVF